jgi:hypothetical protein
LSSRLPTASAAQHTGATELANSPMKRTGLRPPLIGSYVSRAASNASNFSLCCRVPE